MTKTSKKAAYHHGDLRAALLAAGEAVLAETGIEAFSLRAVAKRAGVSHAAPAHHFGDARGLLTALAAEGYRRFLELQHRREAVADPDPRRQLVAAGMGYIDFATQNPALFRLMFSSDRPNYADAELGAASRAAYDHLVAQNRAVSDVGDEAEGYADIAATWAIAHGLADLLASGRLTGLLAMTPDARDAVLSGIILRNVRA